MTGLSGLDFAALGFFLFCWGIYHFLVEGIPSRPGLNQLMDAHRNAWIETMRLRDNRIVDTSIMAGLQNGTAFFASTSLIAIGAAITLIRYTDEVSSIFAEMPFGGPTTRLHWEIKVVGLAIIFVYAFFKFAWSYRLFNYTAILIGAVPPKGVETPETEGAAARAAAMNVVAGRHFNRGQRAFFFALAYLGWFIGPYLLIIGSAAAVLVMLRRQFGSDAVLAIRDDRR